MITLSHCDGEYIWLLSFFLDVGSISTHATFEYGQKLDSTTAIKTHLPTSRVLGPTDPVFSRKFEKL
jgi:hypothetical protein